MLLDHARVGMSQIFRHDHERTAIHDRVAGVGVAEAVEVYDRADSRRLAGVGDGTKLVRGLPTAPG